MKQLLLIFILSFTALAYGQEKCTIESYKSIIKINKILDESIIKNSNCSSEIQSQFLKFISAADGEVNARYASIYFQSEFNTQVTLAPKKIGVHNLSKFLEEQLSLSENLTIDKVSSLYSRASLNLKSASQIKVSCTNCSTPGDKNILLNIAGNKHWVSASLKTLRKAYILNSDINFFQKDISRNQIRAKVIKDNGATNLFTDIKNLPFYRITRNLRKNDVLRVSDLAPKTIIQMGQKVQVLLKSKNLQLKLSAVAKRSGKLGDIIQLYNPKSKKDIQAKVINFNKAIIEL